jgi:general secretion pathway protein C
LGLGLFGNPEAAAIETVVEANSAPRDGIEQGASETRLALRLTGIVASTEDGLGSAVIAAKNVEATYAVGDALPVSGDVTLAKVMATQVVISNNGTYELLKLFEDSTLSAMVPEASARPAQQPARTQPAVEVSSGAQAAVDPSQQAAVARAVRERLYDNPQSLARLVQVAAVRDEQGIRGYRVSPGQDAAQFRALGFQPGDVITSVNGLSLSDPANTVRLYQMMRDARDATIEVERNGSTTSLSVSLDSQAGE